jgi:rSAM/selenodomain-associated transferase 1
MIIFAKSPRMGLSKTRLARDIGVVPAWRAKRRLDAYTCQIVRDPRWTSFLAVAPDRDVGAAFPHAWPPSLARIKQGKGDLGERMARALRHFSRAPVCIIGSDLPDLRAQDLADAFKALRRNEAVFGPAQDGGFWLIGLSPRAARNFHFSPIRWSSRDTLADTLAGLPAHWRVAYLRELDDLDDGESYRRSAQRQSG